MTKLKDGPGEENNPIVQYQEWTEHRYDPGHWLGGNVPPATRSLYSGMNRRWLGVAYVGATLLSVALAVHYSADRDNLILILLMVLVVYGGPGLIMLFARDQKRRRPPRGRHHEHPSHRHENR
jgi:hypothetical protein